MSDSPLANLDGSRDPVDSCASEPGLTSQAEPRFFRNPTLPFGFVRVILYLLVGDGIAYGLRWVARFFLGRQPSPYDPEVLLIGETVALIGALSAAWGMSRLEKRPWGTYGLPLLNAFGKSFWLGASFGLVEISVVVGGMAVLGAYRFGVIVIHGRELLHWAIFWAIFFVLVGLYEEFAFRGYVQFTLAEGMGFWPAAALLSIAFGLRHTGNPGETWVGIAGVILTGFFWCFTLRRTGNLWFAVGMHASFDFGETFLYSVPDSGVVFPGHLSSATLAGPPWMTGGTAGPEASVFDFGLILLFFYAFHRLYPPSSTDSGGGLVNQLRGEH